MHRRRLTPARLAPTMSIIVAATLLALLTAISTPVGAQLTPIEDEPGLEAPGLGNIVGSPEAGPDPEDAGDRGGWAQLGLAGVLVVAITFIGSRIRKESRRGRGLDTRSTATPPDASSGSTV